MNEQQGKKSIMTRRKKREPLNPKESLAILIGIFEASFTAQKIAQYTDRKDLIAEEFEAIEVLTKAIHGTANLRTHFAILCECCHLGYSKEQVQIKAQGWKCCCSSCIRKLKAAQQLEEGE